ncbi:MAG: glutamine--fructose-6-phosphate transaminase (isomerizing) [Clostridiales Family XIII bacterium]|jgi:glucosamine--fructose-6-phosphate aminotransferase (isomerizing)|nr:glutamine--fructose-6-phosphate transaminase (isomerizing) [Clostridiales Family XIII bacterium]
MCGIVGYIGGGSAGAKRIVTDGLKRLEYRGYDSAGIALAVNGRLVVEKAVGRIANLEEILKASPVDSHAGIGHTRWATHGAPSQANAHPHTNADGSIAIVHNGIIENYAELKERLIAEHGVSFRSETDSEIAAHLIGLFYKGDLLAAVREAVREMRGAYSICAMAAAEPDRIVAVRKDAPLIAGIGENCNFLASDIPALLKHARMIYLIENNETVLVTRNDITIFNERMEAVKRDVFHVTWDADAAEKGGYDHFMRKEIFEQPAGIAETLNRRLDEKGEIKLDGISLTKEDLDRIDRIYIVACGTASHAGLVGKFAIERFARIPTETDIASEFRYREPYIDDRTLFVCISQSGETLDTLAALREAKSRGARVLSVVNVVGSSVARESDDVFYTWAGPEIAVASTKAFTTQLVCMYLLALYMGRTRGVLSDAEYARVLSELSQMPDKLTALLEDEPKIRDIAKKVYKNENIFFIGRGSDVSVALEGSLKLKEISYIHSFAIAAGELKHGTIALIEQGSLVIVLASQDRLFEKLLSNIEEVKARGAYVIGLAKAGNREIEKRSDEVIYIPACADEVTPILAVVPLQLLAYHVAKLRGCDIDKPKNLAKAVTVE